MFRFTVFAFEYPTAGEHRGDFLAVEAESQTPFLQQVVLVGIEQEFFSERGTDAGG